jgi:hypothetical protein
MVFDFARFERLFECPIVFYACRCCPNSSSGRMSTSNDQSRQFDTGMRGCAGKQSGRCTPQSTAAQHMQADVVREAS